MTGSRNAVVAGLFVVLGLSACTRTAAEPDKPEPSVRAVATASPSAAAVGSSETPQRLAEQYLVRSATVTVLASVEGTVQDGRGQDVPGTLELLAVEADDTSTAVRWRLSSDDPIDTISTNYYRRQDRAVPDTSAVVLTAKSADLRLDPGTWTGDSPSAQACTCAYHPGSLGPEGVELSSLYPALPPAVTEVQLRVPGFPEVSAEVTRR